MEEGDHMGITGIAANSSASYYGNLDNHNITSKELKEEKDWREISDEEWDKMLEGFDDYIDAYKERLKELKKMQDEAANKAASKAASDMKAIAAASAALKVAANGFIGGDNGEDDSELPPAEDGEEHEKNWTKKLDTDDQTILRVAQKAQDIEKEALSKLEEIKLMDTTTTGVVSNDKVTESASLEEENKGKIWTITTYTDTGIISNKCQNGEIIHSW